MTVPATPIVQRSCALPGCGVVDDGPRHVVALPSGGTTWFHNPGDPACGHRDGGDPYPHLDEPAVVSQQRLALTLDPGSPTPADTEYLTTHAVDASVPGADTEVLSPDPTVEA